MRACAHVSTGSFIGATLVGGGGSKSGLLTQRFVSTFPLCTCTVCTPEASVAPLLGDQC